MARVPTQEWNTYVRKLSALNSKASDAMKTFVLRQGYGDTSALIDYAYGLATKYGEGAAALSATYYDTMAELEGAKVALAEPAQTASYHTVAKAVQGVADKSYSAEMLGGAVGRLVKRAGADTVLQNAKRDGAQFAWIPQGETCAFCLMLASRGWQYMSKNALKNGHAEHIHAHCDCTYAIRFDGSTEVPGYDPQKYRDMYDSADGSTPQERLNSMRRDLYKDAKEAGEKEPSESEVALTQLSEMAKANNLTSLAVKEYETQPTEEEIIARLGGGDMTGGSCSSLAMAYAGQKQGYDVLDFRGGTSADAFSRKSNISNVAKAFNGDIVKNTNDFKGATELLGKMQTGKEYYFAVGKHAAIVKRLDSGFEYLELQTESRNGWYKLTRDALKNRFGCKSSHSSYGYKYEVTNMMFPVDGVENNKKAYQNILSYINTESGSQLKGASGYAK